MFFYIERYIEPYKAFFMWHNVMIILGSFSVYVQVNI